MDYELTEEERLMLVKLLSSSLAETRDEIYRTERSTFKELVRAEKNVIVGLLAKLEQDVEKSTHS